MLGSAQDSDLISPNSFCGLIFTRAIDMNLGPSFFDNSLNKNDEHFVVYYSETLGFFMRF